MDLKASHTRDEVTLKQAIATVRIQRIRGVPEPQPDPSPPEFPVVDYSYRISYDFLQQHPPETQTVVIVGEHRGDVPSRADVLSGVTPFTMTGILMHTTAALAWDQCMYFLHTQTFVVQDLPALKRFLIRGLWLRLEEEKVLSWPSMPEETKPPQTLKDRKEAKSKESSGKGGSREKSAGSKDKKKKCGTDLVQEAPITTVLGCVHVPLHGLLTGDPTVSLRCDLGFLPTKAALRPEGPSEKDSVSKTKEDKKKEEKKSKPTGDSTSVQRNVGSSKGRGKQWKDRGVEMNPEEAGAPQQEPITVEFSICLKKWRSASEANELQLSLSGQSKACPLTPGPPEVI
ncbi:unnamed protein product [Boreogadus saida]